MPQNRQRVRLTVGADRSFKIAYLADAPFVLPVLERWFIDEWGPWYGPSGEGDARADLEECCNRDMLPIAIVALSKGNEILGTAALKPASLGSELGYGPWLAAVLVGKEQRGQGIGGALIEGIEERARQLGFEAIFTTTESAAALVRRRGWAPLGVEVDSLRGAVPIYRLKL